MTIWFMWISSNQTKRANDMYSSIGQSLIISPAAEILQMRKMMSVQFMPILI